VSEWTVGATSFSLDVGAGALTVTGDLEAGTERDFQRACLQLLAEDAKHIVVDLGEVTFICSACLGSLFLLQERAKPRKIQIRLRVNAAIAPICRMMGLDEVADIEVVQ
jgi:anti-sigma B factor antagonist